MCGIIGYAGPRTCKELILDGLEALEYRGYDSAGMVLIEGARLDVTRRIGSVANLRAASAGQASTATLGMGHTRWATHGGVEDRNAHPFLSNDGRFAVLMNGIFENYVELRREVSERGHELSSDTDTEALVHLVADAYDGDLVEAVRAVYPKLHGHFAFLVVALDQPDTIVAARHAWPPLVVGVGEGEMYIASFVPAFLRETRNVQHVREDEIVELTPRGAVFHPLLAGAPPLERAIEEVDASLEVAEMGGYETFMMKEITEQPAAIAATIGERLRDGETRARRHRPQRRRAAARSAAS